MVTIPKLPAAVDSQKMQRIKELRLRKIRIANEVDSLRTAIAKNVNKAQLEPRQEKRNEMIRENQRKKDEILLKQSEFKAIDEELQGLGAR